MDDATAAAPHPGLLSLLEHMGKIEASDLYLAAGHPPVFRVEDVSYPARVPLAAEDIVGMAETLMSAAQRLELHATREMNVTFALGHDTHVRFRASLFFQRGALGMVIRREVTKIRTLEELGLPLEVHKLALAPRGLVLVAGEKRSGRSTTLAAMIDHRNASLPGHIVTIEDAIEFAHTHKQCVVTQREVGVDTLSIADALRAAGGQAPDLIFVSEIRDALAMEALLALCEAGYTCLSSLSASSAPQAIERVTSLFAPERLPEIRARLARVLRGVIAQRLVPALPKGRMAVVELLLHTPANAAAIARGDAAELLRALDEGNDGSRSFDGALFSLFTAERLGYSEMLKAADDAASVLRRLQRVQDGMGPGKVTLRLAVDAPAPAAAAAASAERRNR